MTEDVLGCTGHRPHRLGGFDKVTTGKLLHLAVWYLHETKPDRVVSGMALGWDQAIADAAQIVGIPVTAAIPCDEYEMMWAPHLRVRYYQLLEKCDHKVVVTPGPYVEYEVMFTRNRWVVDNCTQLVALFDGKKTGGTNQCLEYARSKRVPSENLWERWLEVRGWKR